MSYNLLLLLIIVLPLSGFAVLSIFSKRIKPAFAGILGCLILTISAALAIYVAYGYFFEFGKHNGAYIKHIAGQFSWLQLNENLSINIGIVLDPISAMMIVLITIVSSLVHLYSFSYMKGESRFGVYYAYLSLFTFAMLGLVVSINLIQMYIFWELVGISSFLLIGFYFTKPSAIAAAKKAFIITRFADLGFLIGILMLSYGAKTLDFFTLIDRLTQAGSPYLLAQTGSTFIGLSALSWSLLLVFIGGAGKSAMFPLHIWLPDAMEGPTPVSALIHAATMVVAGVFLIARLFPVFAISAPEILTIIAYVGAISALLAAIIACVQTDIKRVLAYSTISQIGFMMLSIGVAGWSDSQNEGFTASMFHLFTHGFFKALLFLGAGVVIHSVHSNEMENMGGLRKSLPLTHITFLLACLAISGVPPFAGFFSKEAILFSAFKENLLLFYIAMFTSGLTSFYIFRLYFRIFWSDSLLTLKPHTSTLLGDKGVTHTSEKNILWMKIPLVILSLGCVFTGFIPFGNYVSVNGKDISLPLHITFASVPITIGIAGIAIAFLMYYKQNNSSVKITAAFGKFYKWTLRKFYFDEIYLYVTQKIIFNLIGKPSAWFDRNVVDGLMNETAVVTEKTAGRIKGMQSGKLPTYTMYFLGGILILALILVITF